jgi:hypothetical protein
MSAGDDASVRAFLQRSGGDWTVAPCPSEWLERLRQGDHHVVVVGGREGLLLTYHLWAEELSDPQVYVLFRHVAGHPRAPADVQQVVDELAIAKAWRAGQGARSG